MLKRLLATVLILLFVILSYNKVSNWHTHIVNGVIIQHAHASSDKSQQKHSHTKAELTVIAITDGNFLENSIFPNIPIIAEQDYTFEIHKKIQLISNRFIRPSNKSPPFCNKA